MVEDTVVAKIRNLAKLSAPYLAKIRKLAKFANGINKYNTKMKENYTKIAPDDVYLSYLPKVPTEADRWMGLLPNEWGNKPTRNDFVDLFAGHIRRMGHCQVKDVARKMGVELKHLHYAILAMTGMGPQEWMAKFVTRAACELLEQTDWTVMRIARELNFSAPAALSRFFLRMTGMSPMEWRARNAG